MAWSMKALSSSRFCARRVFPQYGGLEIVTSSTALQALTDAVLYLVTYPFECSEQLSSRILAVAALRDVLTAFQAEGCPPGRDGGGCPARYDRLQGMQNEDGGFPYWRRGQDSIPFNTIHVAHALAPSPRVSTVPPICSSAHGIPAPDRKSLSVLVLPVYPPDAQRICPLRAQPDGRPRSAKALR